MLDVLDTLDDVIKVPLVLELVPVVVPVVTEVELTILLPVPMLW